MDFTISGIVYHVVNTGDSITITVEGSDTPMYTGIFDKTKTPLLALQEVVAAANIFLGENFSSYTSQWETQLPDLFSKLSIIITDGVPTLVFTN